MSEHAKDGNGNGNGKKHDSMVRWLLAGVGAGLLTLGGFVGSWITTQGDRDVKAREFVQELLRTEGEERKMMAAAINAQTSAFLQFTDKVTTRLDTLIADQRKFPAVRAANDQP